MGCDGSVVYQFWGLGSRYILKGFIIIYEEPKMQNITRSKSENNCWAGSKIRNIVVCGPHLLGSPDIWKPSYTLGKHPKP